MRRSAHRLLAALVVALWMAPSVGAVGVGLHVVLDHYMHGADHHAAEHHGSEPHDQHGADHARDLTDLLEAAAHGHHHDAQAAPDHEHPARFDLPTSMLRPGASPAAVLTWAGPPDVALADWPRLDLCCRHGPPAALFTAHCSLLL